MAGLTELKIRALKPPIKGQTLVSDPSLKGFGIRVSQGGSKTFVLRRGKDRQQIVIGKYIPEYFGLSQARTEAKRLLAEFTLGKVRPQSITYAAAVELFLADKARARRRSTVHGYRLKLGRLKFKGQLADISHAEAGRQLDKLKAPSERSHVLVAAKVFFNWAAKRRYIEHNPFFGLTKPAQVARTRVLSDAELKAVWSACEDGTFSTIIKLCILTGQRRGELSLYQPSFLEGDLCTFPPTITKNHRRHSFPLPSRAVALVTALPATSPGPLRFGDWGRGKKLLDERTGINEPWTIHDIRRTYRTIHSRIGTPPHIAERLMNHITYAASALEWVYDQHAFIEEMRKAVTAYEAYLKSKVILA